MSYSGGCAGLHYYTLSHMSLGQPEPWSALQELARPPNLGPIIIRDEDYSALAYSLPQESSALGHGMKRAPCSPTPRSVPSASASGVHLARPVIHRSAPMILIHQQCKLEN